MKKKLVMVGIDAADIEFITASPSLTILNRLIEEGRTRLLESSARLLSGSPWPSFCSQSSPGEHGMYFPMQWDPETMRQRRLSIDWFTAEPFWHLFDREGIKVTALDVPFTFPGNLRNGLEVINWGTHDTLGPFFSNDRRIGQNILRQFGRHPMGYDIPLRRSTRELAAIQRNLVEGARRKGELSVRLLETTEWDFFITVFSECHRGGHNLWPNPGDATLHTTPTGLLNVYQAVETSLSNLLNAVDRKTTRVVMFSLHGMGSNNSQVHLLPSVLDRINARFQNPGGSIPTAETKPGFIRSMRGRIPAPVQRLIARSVPVQVRDWVIDREFTGAKDWASTPAFALRCDLQGAIRFNLKGRELKGVLTPGSEQFGEYLDWLHQCLSSLKDRSSGMPLVKEIIQSKDVFQGARTAFLPDIIIQWNELPQSRHVTSELLGDIRAVPGDGRPGEHRPTGFVTMPDGIETAVSDISELGSLARSLLGMS